jgi:hypothetical protein
MANIKWTAQSSAYSFLNFKLGVQNWFVEKKLSGNSGRVIVQQRRKSFLVLLSNRRVVAASRDDRSGARRSRRFTVRLRDPPKSIRRDLTFVS